MLTNFNAALNEATNPVLLFPLQRYIFSTKLSANSGIIVRIWNEIKISFKETYSSDREKLKSDGFSNNFWGAKIAIGATFQSLYLIESITFRDCSSSSISHEI